jgi:signal transduction histidine kinase
LAAYFFGYKGGLLYALICSLIYAPHILMQWSHDPHQRFTQFVEIVMFFIIASLVGFLAEIQRRQPGEISRHQAEQGRMERLKLLGTLAAGLAHEIKNPLNSLIGSAEILGRGMEPGGEQLEFVTIIQKELSRLNKKLDEFLSFARSRPLDLVPNDINDILNSIASLLRGHSQKNQMEIKTSLADESRLIPLDAESIKQVLLNLCLNSLEATPAGKEIILRAFYTKTHLVVTVQDTGPGISPENRKKIFDPFFTTKAKGTGLGLSIATRIIENHYGLLTLDDSEPGTCFKIMIPYGT